MVNKLNGKQLKNVFDRWHEVITTDNQQRYGQALFNVLHELYPDTANEIRGTEYDPFYNNNKIGDCLQHIETRF